VSTIEDSIVLTSNVTNLEIPKCNRLHELLLEVIDKEEFNRMRVAEIVGTLEFLKFNLINQSERE